MPALIVVEGRTNALSYTVTGTGSVSVEAISADIDTTGVTPGLETACDAIYRDQSGSLIARSRSSFTLQQGGVVTMTFAPWLPDTFELDNNLSGFINTTGLCATSLPPGATVTVQAVDAAAIVTEARLWVTSSTDGLDTAEAALAALGAFMLVPGPGA